METCPHKILYMNVYSSTIHNSQKVETIQMALNWWMDKQNGVHPYNGILFRHKKKWKTDTATAWRSLENTMLSERHQPQKTIYQVTPFLGNVQDMQICRDKKWINGGLKGKRYQLKGMWVLRCWKRSTIVVIVVHTCDHIKNHWVVHFKWVSCMIYELYLNKAVF